MKTGECVVLCLGIGVCMLMCVVKFKCVILCLIITTYHIRNYITFCISIFAGYHML